VIYLIDLLMQTDKTASSVGKGCMVSEGNLGTLLLVGVILSLKFNRDHGIRNSEWGRVLQMPVSVINESEAAFVRRIGYSMEMDMTCYKQIVMRVFGYSVTEVAGDESGLSSVVGMESGDFSKCSCACVCAPHTFWSSPEGDTTALSGACRSSSSSGTQGSSRSSSGACRTGVDRAAMVVSGIPAVSMVPVAPPRV
jgi:hypothetical protein